MRLWSAGIGYTHVSTMRRTRVEQFIIIFLPKTESELKKVEKLTKREYVILEHVASRETNKQIGESLTISENTVKGHITNINRKLNLHNRGELISFYHKMVRKPGLLTRILRRII